MKKISSAIIKIAVVILAVFFLIIAANAGNVSNTPNVEKKTESKNVLTEFYANITFSVFEGEGCECVPLRGSFINATGRDTDHSAFGVTNDKGVCVLQLQFDKTYRVSVQISNHESVLYDFNVLDDQSFTFNLKKTQASSTFVPLSMHAILQRVLFIKKILN
jgi:hypothetical protein